MQFFFYSNQKAVGDSLVLRAENNANLFGHICLISDFNTVFFIDLILINTKASVVILFVSHTCKKTKFLFVNLYEELLHIDHIPFKRRPYQ